MQTEIELFISLFLDHVGEIAAGSIFDEVKATMLHFQNYCLVNKVTRMQDISDRFVKRFLREEATLIKSFRDFTRK